MKLIDYPAAIYKLRSAQIETQYELERLQHYLDTLLIDVDMVIAFDDDLKNEPRRKAKRALVLSEHVSYQEALAHSVSLTQAIAYQDIELERLRSTMSILKLQLRTELDAS